MLGPHALGAKGALPWPLAKLGSWLLGLVDRLPIPVPMIAANVQLQFIHEDDVGEALIKCVVGAGPPGAYNIAADGVLTGTDIVRELGLSPIPLPSPCGSRRSQNRSRGPDAVVRATRSELGRVSEPPFDHGHHEGSRSARLDAGLFGPRGAAGDGARPEHLLAVDEAVA